MSLSMLQKNVIAFLTTELGRSVKQVAGFAGQISPGEVRKAAVFPPAVLVYVGGGAVERMNGGFMMINTTNTAYCLTSFNDRAVNANQDAMRLAEHVAEMIEGERFGLDCRTCAANITAVGNGHQLGLADKGISLWLVNWEQSIVFGHKDWLAFEKQMDLPALPLDVWLGDEQLTEGASA